MEILGLVKGFIPPYNSFIWTEKRLRNVHKTKNFNNMQLEQKIAKTLIRRGLTLSVAESCTGGLLTHRLTNISGSSKFLMATVVSYSNAAKMKLLKVPASLLEKHGAVSAPAVKHMAQGVRRLLNTDLAVSITGIAGPTGGTATKPVGLVFIAACSRRKVIIQKNIFKGTRLQVKTQAVNRALALLAKIL